MKKLQKVILLVLLMVVGVLVPEKVHASDVIKIGILQSVEHGSYDENRRGMIEGLEELGYKEGDNVEIEYLNAGGDNATLASMAQTLAQESDYLFAVGTPSAQALANVTQEIPIYFSAVTDPVGGGIVSDLEKPGANVTGTSNLGPIEKQIDLLLSVYPDAKKIGILYNSGEVNSQYQVDIALKAIEERGLESQVAVISSTNDIQSVFTPLLTEVDAVYLVTDNTVATAMSLVGDMAKENNIGIFGGSNDMILENGLATYGLDYYSLGKQTAGMLVDHIQNGTNPAETPVEYADELVLIVNEDYAKAVGIDPKTIKVN